MSVSGQPVIVGAGRQEGSVEGPKGQRVEQRAAGVLPHHEHLGLGQPGGDSAQRPQGGAGADDDQAGHLASPTNGQDTGKERPHRVSDEEPRLPLQLGHEVVSDGGQVVEQLVVATIRRGSEFS